ncbi:hypothetical protein JAAARDRAFT_46407 [Jaapia argillacea MUCL 33604]|uniref:Uncharacterized protein n=1 Tax=Jaapia argillacea MUCL 33604 TaxID=933084 RepID=A0A067QB12_9AGAM|nr:hypothetical protein JAAARDRAFT_46407 [Jaapia argillacea MUCL 33604]
MDAKSTRSFDQYLLAPQVYVASSHTSSFQNRFLSSLALLSVSLAIFGFEKFWTVILPRHGGDTYRLPHGVRLQVKDRRWRVCNVLWAPPLGTREIHLRADARFGNDDFTRWPQAYNSVYPHFMAIPRKPIDPTHELAPLWWTPMTIDHIPISGSIVTGLSRLAGPSFNSLYHVKHSCLCLRDIATPYKEMVFGVSEYQRFCLELVGFIDYMSVFHDRMNDLVPGVGVDGVDDTRLGVFTYEARVVQMCVVGGIPVWYLHSPEALSPTINVLAVADCWSPSDFIVMDEWDDVPFPVIWKGDGFGVDSIRAIHNFTRTFTLIKNPFSAPTDHLLTPSSSATITWPLQELTDDARRRGKNRYAPYPSTSRDQSSPSPSLSSSKTVARKPPPPREKFKDPQSPLVPPPIFSWQKALENVDRSRRPSDATAKLEYQFPDPGLFLNLQSDEKQARFILCWLATRAAWLYQVSAPSDTKDADAVSGQLWRTWLNQDIFDNSPQEPTSGTRSGRRFNKINKILGPCLRAKGVEASPTIKSVFWQELEFNSASPPDVAVVRQVLWELYENNFRMEFLTLDRRTCQRRLTESEQVERVVYLSNLLAGPGSFIVTRPPDRDYGLASANWRERTVVLAGLRDLMADWRGNKPHAFGIRRPKSEVEWSLLESAVASFYTQSFFDTFRRAAILPRKVPA